MDEKYAELLKVAYSHAVVLDTWALNPTMFNPEEAHEMAEELYAELHKVTGLEDLTAIDPD